ncbi:M48 family metallopeptidase [Uliginosibacterium sp. TH139]|uniref:M48 family metallopeptidase n=1 Tax=Uliginosibacterium sp. TH139 TaxID=2067453 RepID=UPI000C7D9F6C|nr:SprT family zinc-dependent metalloprotease [Uliginosibacterium sp. TH139]PLK49338.1 M48 family peptidase [Uliginosibacterium sp. TH139]
MLAPLPPNDHQTDSSAAEAEGCIQMDGLQFAIRRSSRRRTMQITVERTGELILSAPPEVGIDRLREFVSEKRFWIYTKLAEKDRLQRKVPRKEFVAGEGFLYLGRTHRLKLVDGQDSPLKLVNGRFALCRDAQAGAREHFIRWYSDRARVWLSGRVADYQSRMEVAPAGVKVQDLGYRWGSCGKGDWLYFHWKTILLPARIAEYVVVHEIAHLHEPHHTPAFWLRVERAMPDYAQRRAWLAEHGIDVEGI